MAGLYGSWPAYMAHGRPAWLMGGLDGSWAAYMIHGRGRRGEAGWREREATSLLCPVVEGTYRTDSNVGVKKLQRAEADTG